jgi:hypothetical protein
MVGQSHVGALTRKSLTLEAASTVIDAPSQTPLLNTHIPKTSAYAPLALLNNTRLHPQTSRRQLSPLHKASHLLEGRFLQLYLGSPALRGRGQQTASLLCHKPCIHWEGANQQTRETAQAYRGARPGTGTGSGNHLGTRQHETLELGAECCIHVTRQNTKQKKAPTHLPELTKRSESANLEWESTVAQ